MKYRGGARWPSGMRARLAIQGSCGGKDFFLGLKGAPESTQL